MANDKLIHVVAKSPAQVLYDGPAWAVSSRNSEGNFDILANHANFITIIENQPILIRKADKTVVELRPKTSILYTVANQVFIYTDPKVNR